MRHQFLLRIARLLSETDEYGSIRPSIVGTPNSVTCRSRNEVQLIVLLP